MKKDNHEKILVITSCSAKKKKTKKPLKAEKLYQGDFFKKVRKFTYINNFDLKIISAKYGLINPKDKIETYNKRIKNDEDIQKLQEKIIPRLKREINQYDKILLFMGEDYKKILEPLRNEKFIYLYDKRGLGGYKSLMKDLLYIENNLLLKILYNASTKQKDITVKFVNKYKNNYKIL